LRTLETSLETKSESVAFATSTPTRDNNPPLVTGKMKLLKFQLEEARKKEEEERAQNHDLAALVRDLQRDVGDRDRTIHQMREEGFSVASFTGSPPGSPFVMSPGNRSPTSPTSRSPPLGRSYDSVTSGMEGYRSFNQGFAEKEEKILELQEKNIELERKIMDMDENLIAKDDLIRARTEAVTLLSADLSLKGRNTLDQLEETRTEMRLMQSQFAQKEAEWRESTTLAEVDMAAKDRRFKNMEQDMARLDRARFELCTKNAVLQEKVVGLQSELQSYRRNCIEEEDKFDEERTEMRSKIEDLEKDLRIARQMREDKHRAFIADLVEETGGDKKFGEKVVEMENNIAELEEEKGNLQMKIIDLEDSYGKIPPISQNAKMLNKKYQPFQMSDRHPIS
jgi:hypothetical protein